MMKVSLADIDESFIRTKVECGYYSSVTEAIRDAVRRMRESEQNRIIAALELGEQAIAEGRTKPFTRELADEITARGIAKAKKGEEIIRPDVIPY